MNAPGRQSANRAPDAPPGGMRKLQRKCACAAPMPLDGRRDACNGKRQARLAVGAVDDPLEHEADRIADRVIGSPPPEAVDNAPLRMQRIAGRDSGGSVRAAPPSVERALAGGGRPLEPAVRHNMEQRFGHNFFDVRVHDDAQAHASARDLNAHAYTLGRHIVFAAGKNSPETRSGQHLLAHEMAHVAQGGGATIRRQSAPSATVGAGAASSSVASEGDAGPTPAGAGGSGGTGTCKVEVGATHIGGVLSGLPVWHTLVIYTDPAGDEYYFRGGPMGSCPGVSTGSYGTIRTNNGRYLPGTVDYPPNYRTTAATGVAATGKNSCFASELGRIDGRCVPYAPTGPNSNTVTRTLLANCGIPQVKPVTLAIGWGDPVL